MRGPAELELLDMLGELPPGTLRLLGEGLAASQGPLRRVGSAFWSIADGSEWLGQLQLGVALAFIGENAELVGWLGESEEPLWRKVAEAAAEIQSSVDLSEA